MIFFKRKRYAGLLICLGAALFLFQGAAPKPADPSSRAGLPKEGILEELKLFSRALGAIEEAFVNDVQPRQLLYSAVQGMLAGLGDRYTEFIDPKRYALLQIQLKGEYAGIGAMLEIVDNFPAIRSVRPDSAAHKAGLLAGDKIIRINQVTTQGLPLTEIGPKLRGEAGTALVLTIQRLDGKVFDVEVVRETVQIEAVKDVRMVGKQTGYIWLQQWQEKTVNQVDDAVKKLREQGMRALIIDVRNNDGGLLPMAVSLSKKFLEEGRTIVSVSSKLKEQRKDYISDGDEHSYSDIKLVILVNGRSASASEVFSAAMQDNKRAVLVGVQTFGKASVQSLVPLDENSAMKLTTARYKSPNGRVIDHVGITPDYVIENVPDGQGPDRQVLKAIEILREYM
ncbi:MAG: S41 family peptidase [Candidatus Omnitrophica bacterium]|nr:S41 family peptidase [Candidatus Omnitrophota bacterium]